MPRQRNRKKRIFLFLTIPFLFACGYNLTCAAEQKGNLITKKVTLKAERPSTGKYLSLTNGKVEAFKPGQSPFDARKDIILWSINGDVEIEVGLPAYVYTGKPFAEIKEAPTTGYQDKYHDKTVCETLYVPISLIKEGKATYCVKTEDGNYAKINFTDVDLENKTVTFEWVYQLGQSRKFDNVKETR